MFQRQAGKIMDSISDLLTRIKNGYLARQDRIVSPTSKMRKALLLILKQKGYIADFEVKEKSREFEIKLKYDGEKPAITDLKRMSKPGLRVYAGWEKIPRVLNGLGVCVVSTSKGLMVDSTARKQKIGGELICKVW